MIVETETVVWFEEFWRDYWRKDNKQAAEKAFAKRVKSLEDWNLVRNAIARQRPEMLEREKRHRPTAATWLDEGRMNDEQSPPRINQASGDNVHARNQRRREEVNRMSKIIREQLRRYETS